MVSDHLSDHWHAHEPLQLLGHDELDEAVAIARAVRDEAIELWGTIYDRPPVASEWNPWHLHHRQNPGIGADRIERFFAGEWPYLATVISPVHKRTWGTSWVRFLQLAGFQPLPQGYHYVCHDDGHATRIDGRRLIHSNDHRREYLEGEPLGRRPARRAAAARPRRR